MNDRHQAAAVQLQSRFAAADLALYQAKADGRNRVRGFTPGLALRGARPGDVTHPVAANQAKGFAPALKVTRPL